MHQVNKSILLFSLLSLFSFYSCVTENPEENQNLANLQMYNVIWNSPGKDYFDSMPLGNGDIGLNAWVEENGDLCFYIGKTDSWDENARLLKVGKVRVTCNPKLVFSEGEFLQELDLKTGTVRVHSTGEINHKKVEMGVKLWVDANNPVIHVDYNASVPITLTARIELWRNERDSLPQLETSDLLEDRSKPGSLHEPVYTEPDVLLKDSEKYIGWYHFNQKSVGFNLTNQLQGLSEYFTSDPISNRIFGALVTGEKTKRLSDVSIQTEPSKSGNINVVVLTEHPSNPEHWQKSVENLATNLETEKWTELRKAHENWWKNFWNRSWIYATCADSLQTQPKENDAFLVTQAYILQRFIDASAGRGNFPVKFNGSIFTVPAEGKPGNADYRRWGPGYWWQNTRLPYLSMCAAGDFDLMQPLFKMYAEDVFKLNKFRTEKYFGFEGAYYAECIYFWGSVFTSTYGWEPYETRSDKLQESGYHKWEWVAGPELVFMMLDYFDYTRDEEFLKEKILPVANDVIRFFDNFYKTNENGKLVMYPSQAAETWWDCTNPMPELAGLIGITKRLLALPENLTHETEREFWQKMAEKLPEIPLHEIPSGKALAPAERFEDKRNVENPELYAVFPFRLFGIGNPNLDWAKNALDFRLDRGNFGWRQDDIFMAYLGLTEQVTENLVSRAKQHDENFRFTAFWGPNYDWTPDQDHGGVLMKTFQSMILQADPYSKKMYLLPAWPKKWNAEFKLNAPYNTVVEGIVRNGKLEKISITPESRREDLILIDP